MVSSSHVHDTPDLSDSMRRRLAKENEALQEQQQRFRQQQQQLNAGYPIIPTDDAAGSEEEDVDEDKDLREKLDLLPTPPPDYPALHGSGKLSSDAASSWSQRRMGGRISQPAAAGDYRQKRPDTSDPDFEGAVGCFHLASEWVTSLLLDSSLLVVELVVNIWLAVLLKEQGRVGQYQAVLVLFCIPSCINAVLWIKLSKSYKAIGFLFMLALAFLGFPSPLLVYIWHLYLSAFCNQPDSQRSRIVANTFRIVQAFTCSLPLIMLNFYTLLSILRIEGKEKEAFDISQLTKHLSEVNIHGAAAMLSFINILRAASVFNERKTYTLLFVMVGYPYLLFTVLSRILAVGVIACFMDVWWTVVLFAVMVLTNMALYSVCRKRSGSGGLLTPSTSGTTTTKSGGGSSELPSTRQILKTVAIRGDIEEQVELRSKFFERRSESRSSTYSSSSNQGACCCSVIKKKEENSAAASSSSRTESSTWHVVVQQTEESFWDTLPKIFLLSVCSIIIPVGYTNDYRSHHPRIKGGLFILLNYLFNMACIGLALGFTIINDVPNTFHGVALPQPSLKVEVPGSKVIVQAGGLDVALNLPNTHLDLGTMPTFSATLNTDSTDHIHAILFPVILAVITAPFVIMRAAMMELDCFLARRKQLDNGDNNGDEVDGFFGRGKRSLGEAVRRNAENKELKARLYLTVCCSMCGMCVFTVLMVLTGAFLVISLH